MHRELFFSSVGGEGLLVCMAFDSGKQEKQWLHLAVKIFNSSFAIRLFKRPIVSVYRHICKAKSKTILWTSMIFFFFNFQQYLCFMFESDKAPFLQMKLLNFQIPHCLLCTCDINAYQTQ